MRSTAAVLRRPDSPDLDVPQRVAHEIPTGAVAEVREQGINTALSYPSAALIGGRIEFFGYCVILIDAHVGEWGFPDACIKIVTSVDGYDEGDRGD
jgi:hypothetical protein